MTNPNTPPTLADALAPGLSAEERYKRYLAWRKDDIASDNPGNMVKVFCAILDAHARDARIAGINEALKIIRNHEFPCGGVHACSRCSMAAQIDTLLEDDNAQR